MFSSWISLFVVSDVIPDAGFSKEMWNIRYNLNLLSSYNLKLTGFIFSNISYGPNFLKSSLMLGHFILICLRNKYTLSPFFSGGLILRFWLLYFAILKFKNLISLNNCFYNFLNLFANIINCYVLVLSFLGCQ